MRADKKGPKIKEHVWYGYSERKQIPSGRIILSYGYIPGRCEEVSGQVLRRFYKNRPERRPFTYWIILKAPDGSKSLEGFKRWFPSEEGNTEEEWTGC